MGKGYACVGAEYKYQISVSSSQFYFKPKTALNKDFQKSNYILDASKYLSVKLWPILYGYQGLCSHSLGGESLSPTGIAEVFLRAQSEIFSFSFYMVLTLIFSSNKKKNVMKHLLILFFFLLLWLLWANAL